MLALEVFSFGDESSPIKVPKPFPDAVSAEGFVSRVAGRIGFVFLHPLSQKANCI
jgi:hypothetical protein